MIRSIPLALLRLAVPHSFLLYTKEGTKLRLNSGRSSDAAAVSLAGNTKMETRNVPGAYVSLCDSNGLDFHRDTDDTG